MGGHVPLMFDGMPTALPLIRSGKIKAYAVSTPARSPLLPQVPTFRELGYPQLEAVSWMGLWVTPDVPDAVQTRLRDATLKVLLIRCAAPAAASRLGQRMRRRTPVTCARRCRSFRRCPAFSALRRLEAVTAGGREGMVFGDALIARYMNGVQFAERSRGELAQPQIVQSGLLRGETETLNAQVAQYGRSMGVHAGASVGEAIFRCGEAEGFVMATTLFTRPLSGPGVSGWFVYQLAGFIASNARQGHYAKYLLSSMLASLKMNPAWEARSAQAAGQYAQASMQISNAVTQTAIQHARQQAAAGSAGGGTIRTPARPKINGSGGRTQSRLANRGSGRVWRTSERARQSTTHGVMSGATTTAMSCRVRRAAIRRTTRASGPRCNDGPRIGTEPQRGGMTMNRFRELAPWVCESVLRRPRRPPRSRAAPARTLRAAGRPGAGDDRRR